MTMKEKRKPRLFVAEDLVIHSWEDLSPYFEQLLDEDITSADQFRLWLQKNSELEAIVEEEMGWRYIQMTIDTSDKEAAKNYQKFVVEITPYISEITHQINKKLVESPFANALKTDAERIYLRKISNAVSIFREANIPLQTTVQTLTQHYSSTVGSQSIRYDGKDITAQQATVHLKDPNRATRKEVFELLSERRRSDIEKLENTFDELVATRHQMAVNAGFHNFRDYQFKAMNRFDYTVQDCFDFHFSVEKYIVPIHKKIQGEKLKKWGMRQFRPYDHLAEPEGRPPLMPFETGEELLEKTTDVLGKLDPYFSDCLTTMKAMGHLDLTSKRGKAAGGYNYPLYETGVPFIFMNAVGTAKDVITMIHEGGHAVHSFLTRDLPLTAYKQFPSEIAELASMSMELLSMRYWNCYYEREDDAKRAKKEHIESIVAVLPWVVTIDAFQHWIYEHPTHSREERKEKWVQLGERFGAGMTDWTDYEDTRDYSWHQQLHLFEVPFYYIEYGFSQLGALGVWKNALQDEAKTVDRYKAGLSLGYTKSIKDVYQTVGVPFDFSTNHMKHLSQVLSEQLEENDSI